ncbi:hypothetical protein GCM10009799_27540 [Nocardiopsis rhodophaea]|uniref:Uncharacterized protein n=1 Tax=Nocardiopsis rhodophaea TaxID=280238 RepID=A0ABP5EHU3_9ACTN
MSPTYTRMTATAAQVKPSAGRRHPRFSVPEAMPCSSGPCCCLYAVFPGREDTYFRYRNICQGSSPQDARVMPGRGRWCVSAVETLLAGTRIGLATRDRTTIPANRSFDQ